MRDEVEKMYRVFSVDIKRGRLSYRTNVVLSVRAAHSALRTTDSTCSNVLVIRTRTPLKVDKLLIPPQGMYVKM